MAGSKTETVLGEAGSNKVGTRPGGTMMMMDNVTVDSLWKENFRMSHPSFKELCEDLRPLLERK